MCDGSHCIGAALCAILSETCPSICGVNVSWPQLSGVHELSSDALQWGSDIYYLTLSLNRKCPVGQMLQQWGSWPKVGKRLQNEINMHQMRETLRGERGCLQSYRWLVANRRNVFCLSGSGALGMDPFSLPGVTLWGALRAGLCSTAAQGSSAQGGRAQGSRAQGSRAQGSRAQGSNAQGIRAQGSRAQDSNAQGGRAQASSAQGSRTQGSNTQGRMPRVAGPRVAIPRASGPRPAGPTTAGPRPEMPRVVPRLWQGLQEVVGPSPSPAPPALGPLHLLHCPVELCELGCALGSPTRHFSCRPGQVLVPLPWHPWHR